MPLELLMAWNSLALPVFRLSMMSKVTQNTLGAFLQKLSIYSTLQCLHAGHSEKPDSQNLKEVVTIL